MAKPLLSDRLWQEIAPLRPPEPPKPNAGRPRIRDRAALRGMLFVLKTGLPWEYLPQAMGGGSGLTCGRRLRDWQRAGVGEHLPQHCLDRLGTQDRLDWERALLDSARVPAKRGAPRPGRTPRIAPSPAASTTSCPKGKAVPGSRR